MVALNLFNSAKFGAVANWLEQKTTEASMPSSDVEIEGDCFQGRRAKRVSNPLNEIGRERLCGNHPQMSDGSEYDEAEFLLSLGNMACGFMEDAERVRSNCNCLNGNEYSLSERDFEEINSAQILESGVASTNATDLILLGYITHTVDIMTKANERFDDENENKRCIRKAIMNNLRSMGYNAGICNSLQDHILQFLPGDYEYIDVILERKNVKRKERIFVDIDFRAQFEVARPTKEYSASLQLLPHIFVGKADRLQKIINIMCEGAKRSLQKKSMHIPPWRKYRYMRSKWLGSHRRTTNPVSNPRRDINPSNCDVPHREWQWQPPSKPAKIDKVSGLARAFTQLALTSSIF